MILYTVNADNSGIEPKCLYQGTSHLAALFAYAKGVAGNWDSVELCKHESFEGALVGDEFKRFEYSRFAAVVIGLASFGGLWYYTDWRISSLVALMLFANNLGNLSK